MSHLVELDSRRRVSLGQLARHDRYIVTQEPDGTLVLTPAVVMTELEAQFLRNTGLLAKIEAAHADPSLLVPRPSRKGSRSGR